MAIEINDTAPRVQYIATAGQTVFAVPFEFFAAADLVVYINAFPLSYNATPTTNSQFSVTGAGVTGGGTVTIGGEGVPIAQVVTILRDIPVDRVTDFPLAGPFQIDRLNLELDRITAMVQQIEAVLQKRVVKLADFDQPSALSALPRKDDRKGKTLAFDSVTGDIVAGPPIEAYTNAFGYIDELRAAMEGALASVLAAFDDFDTRYLGSFATAPTTGPGGIPLVAGNIYYDSDTLEFMIWNGTTWVSSNAAGADYLPLSATTVYTRSLLTSFNAAEARTKLELGTAAQMDIEDFATSGTASVDAHALLTSGTHGITAFGSTLTGAADLAALLTILGQLGSITITGTSAAGHIEFHFSDTSSFKIQWQTVTVTSSGLAVTYPTAFTSWAHAIININNGETGASSVYCVGGSYTKTGVTLANEGNTVTGPLISWGV